VRSPPFLEKAPRIWAISILPPSNYLCGCKGLMAAFSCKILPCEEFYVGRDNTVVSAIALTALLFYIVGYQG